MILIHPPVAKPGEPPAGLAKIAGALRQNNIPFSIIDANLEGLLALLKPPPEISTTWTKRAARHLSTNLASLNQWTLYREISRYGRAVKDINRILEVTAQPYGVRLGLANYQHKKLSPVRSKDLIEAAETPEKNPFYDYFKNRFKHAIEEEKPSFVGLSLNYLSQALTTFAIIGFIRQLHPGIKVIMGGGLITSWMSSPNWQNPFEGLVDHLVAGQGEGPLLSILGIKNARDHAIPDYDDFPIDSYMAPGFVLPYSASSGCYWNKCAFCPEKAEGRPYRPLPAERVQRDLERLIEKKTPTLLHLLDNAISPSLMEAFADVPPGVPWYGFARISKQLTNLDFCRNLKLSGCVMLKLGIESGDQQVLDSLEKGFDLQEASTVLKNLKEVGIAAYVYLLFGTPAETFDEALRTLEFTVQHRHEIGFLNLAIFNMPAYGEDARTMETSDFYKGDLSLYRSFAHPGDWSRQQVRHFLDREFKRNSAVSTILKRDPPIFTSNHAPFFVMSA
ncbi:MAG: radical SAM protein [Deltaproteobacteria bacterium]|nr:radical SAM protein [Deltaproteobacteria bacterium]